MPQKFHRIRHEPTLTALDPDSVLFQTLQYGSQMLEMFCIVGTSDQEFVEVADDFGQPLQDGVHRFLKDGRRRTATWYSGIDPCGY